MKLLHRHGRAHHADLRDDVAPEFFVREHLPTAQRRRFRVGCKLPYDVEKLALGFWLNRGDWLAADHFCLHILSLASARLSLQRSSSRLWSLVCNVSAVPNEL